MKLPAAPPPGRPAADDAPGVAPQAAPPDALFAALMNLITARTAPAEGQSPDPPLATPEQPAPKPSATAPHADGPVLAALLAALTPTAPVAPKAATPAVPAVPVPAAAPTHAAAPRAKQAAPTSPAAPPAPAVPAVPAPATAAAASSAPPKPAPTRDDRPALDKDAAPAAKAPAPAARATAPEHQPLAGEVGAPKDRAAVHAPDAPRPVLRPERVEALVRLATRQGSAEAHMELHPQELGAVVVKLRVTSDGLNATLTATNPDAVAQLQQAGDDLRRSLEAKGITLATLDVRAQSSETGDRREQRGWDRTRDRRRAVGHVDDELAPVTTSIPVGELVDVHA